MKNIFCEYVTGILTLPVTLLLLLISPVANAQTDSLIVRADETAPVDTITAPMDTLAAPADTIISTDTIISIDTITPTVDTIVPTPVITPAAAEISVPSEKKPPFMALRTNLLYDAALIPNIGLEFMLGKGFAIGADWFGTWLYSDKRHIYWQGYGGYLTLRYYFGKAAAECPLTGHHVGIYGSCLTYDIEFGGKGYQAAKFGFGGGVEYGYSLPVGHDLCIDFNIGVGYQGGEYKTYQPTEDGTNHYVWLATYKRHWWGPTKAEISLKWLISPIQKKKKGGEE